MPAIELRPAQRKEFRAQAHHLEPVVRIGGEGLTKAVIKETDAALKAHGLIKVRVFSDERFGVGGAGGIGGGGIGVGPAMCLGGGREKS